MLNHLVGPFLNPARAVSPWRFAVAGSCLALLLVGCGGGDSAESPPAPPPPPQPPQPAAPLAAPANFNVSATYGGFESLMWSATPNAARYELFTDPDGPGPLPEAKVKDYSDSSPSGFSYAQTDTGSFSGSLVNLYAAPSERLNATYRLRACSASECGPLTDARPFDITQGTSYEFLSGLSPLKTTSDAYSKPATVSQDGLTLAIGGRAPSGSFNPPVLVFARPSKTQPWVEQASVTPNNYSSERYVLSADGSTLVVRGTKQITVPGEGTRVVTDAAYVYQRTGMTWSQQARLDTSSAPAGCPQPCQVELAEHMALSSDGNTLALSATTAVGSTGPALPGAVFVYARTGNTWAAQAALAAEGPSIAGMALSGNGSTLAVSAHDSQQSSTSPSVALLARDSNGAWSLQGRVAATLATYQPPISGPRQYAELALSSDGNTLAVSAANLSDARLCNGAAAGTTWGIALYGRVNGAWQSQGQAVIANGAPTGSGTWAPWSLAYDGSALFYKGTLFTRSNGSWTCP